MLPGGLLVLGVFMIATPELAKDGQNALRKVSGVPAGRTATSSAVCEQLSVIDLTKIQLFCCVISQALCFDVWVCGTSEIPVLWDAIC